MATRLIPALVICVVLGALPATAGVVDLGDWKSAEAGWADLKPGSMAHYRTVRERRVPGMKAPVKSVTETKRTLEAVEDAKLLFTTQLKSEGVWLDARKVSSARPPKGTISVEQEVFGRRESVTVEGVSLPCKRIRFIRKRDGIEDDRIVAWISEEHGALKVEKETGPGTLVTHTVTKLALERKIGAVALQCREMSIEAPGTKGRLLVSTELPGRIVEMQVTVEREGARSTVTRTLVGFVKK